MPEGLSASEIMQDVTRSYAVSPHQTGSRPVDQPQIQMDRDIRTATTRLRVDYLITDEQMDRSHLPTLVKHLADKIAHMFARQIEEKRNPVVYANAETGEVFTQDKPPGLAMQEAADAMKKLSDTLSGPPKKRMRTPNIDRLNDQVEQVAEVAR